MLFRFLRDIYLQWDGVWDKVQNHEEYTMKYLILPLIAVSFAFAQWGGGGGKTLNNYKKESVSGRTIYFYAPSDLKAKSPLLLSCHGMNQDPNYQQENTHWEAVADTAGFVVVYPNGGTGMSTWDISGDSDTKWIVQIIDKMAQDYDIDTKRVYLSGFSMGGMLTYNAMSKIADKIAAFAPTSGTNVMGASKAQRPVPIIHPHGTSDDVLGYNQVEGFIKNYRDQFKCPSQAEVQNNYPHQGEKATMYTWGPCDGGVYIKHMKLEGRGHMPSKNEVSDIWNFVKQWNVDGLISNQNVESSSSVAESSSSETAKSSSSEASAQSSSSGTTALLKDLSLNSITVFSSDNHIVVANAQGKSITVFNSLGHIVCTTRGLGNQQRVFTGAKGMYIVKVGGRTFRISL